MAPTGAGKTLAGFLPSLTALAARPASAKPRGLHTLYVSPLKALAGRLVGDADGHPRRVLLSGSTLSLRDADGAFETADGVEVSGARLENGLLHVELNRAVPETIVKTIRIGGSRA